MPELSGEVLVRLESAVSYHMNDVIFDGRRTTTLANDQSLGLNRPSGAGGGRKK